MVVHQCLGSVWSRRNDGKLQAEKVASVYATINQFNAVSRYVIATILQPKLSLGERACIIERWISIAQVGLNSKSLTVCSVPLGQHRIQTIEIDADGYVTFWFLFAGTTVTEKLFVTESHHFWPAVNVCVSSAQNLDVGQQVYVAKRALIIFAF